MSTAGKSDRPPSPLRTTRGRRRPGRPWLLAGALYLVPLALSWLFMATSRDNPFFALPLAEEKPLLRLAADLASGAGLGPAPFFFSPLYVYFLAVLAKLGFGTLTSVRVIQVLLGSLSYPLVHAIASRHFGAKSGLVAWSLALGYGPLLQAGTDLAPSWLETLLLLLAVWRFSLGTTRGNLVLAGLFAGTAALSRPTLLVLAILVPLALLALERRGTARAGGAKAAVFLLAFALPIAPVTARNWLVAGDLVLISSHGGLNFYIGNSPAAGGTLYVPSGIDPSLASMNGEDARKTAERAAGHALSASQASRWWYAQGWDYLVNNPVRGLALYARKGFLLLHSYEVSTTSSYYLLRAGSPVLQGLRVPFAALLTAGVAGLLLARGQRRPLVFLSLTLAAVSLTPLIFFAATRFRLALGPLLAVPAGHALWTAWERWNPRSPDRRLLAAVGAGFAAVLLLSYPYPAIAELERQSSASSQEMLGQELFNRGRIPEAEAAFRRAIALRPTNLIATWYLATILESRGDDAAAMREWLVTEQVYGAGSRWGREARERYERLKAKSPPPR